MHFCQLQDVLSPKQLEVLSEVLKDALDQAKDTLRLHEQDNLGWHDAVLSDTVEVYLEMIALQTKRIATIEELIAMMERPSG